RFMARDGGMVPRPAIKPPQVIYAPAGKEKYRFINNKVKYLKRAEKGIPGSRISPWYPWLKNTTPPPVTLAKVAPQKNKKNTSAVIPFELLEENGLAGSFDVRFGMPFPQGHLFDTENIAVKDPRNKTVPAQFSAISFWPDKSVKFLLTDFKAPLSKKEKSIWQLVTHTRGANYQSPLKYTETAENIRVSTGKLEAVISKKNFNFLQQIKVNGKSAGRFSPDGLTVIGENGEKHTTSGLVPDRVFVEEAGPLRLVIRADGRYSGKIASYTVRMIFRADSPVAEFAITHINTNLKNEFTDITALKLDFLPAQAAGTVTMDGQSAARFFQHHDRKLEINGRFSTRRMSGAGQAGNITFALRDAAKRYPKAIAANGKKITFELLPAQPDAKFGSDLPYYLHFPFCEGVYRLKWGMGFTEELKIDFSGQSSPALLAALEPVPVIDQKWLFDTRLFPGIPSSTKNNFIRWDKKAVEAFYGHMRVKEKQREYGFLNYGDWFGERNRNWTNNEYDLAHGLFMLFLRTGCRDAFRWAKLAARHQADVDIIKAYPDPLFIGANAQHGIGHTGISYQRVNPATWSLSFDYSFVGTNGHTWSEGMTEAWLLGGDIIPMESALLLGEHLRTFAAPLLRRLSTHERSAGWSSTALMGIYRATGDQRYLPAIRHLMQIILDEQKHDMGGAWPHRLPGDHAGGHKETFGNCPYLAGILLRSLREYYLIAPSPEVKKAIISASNWLSRGFSASHCGWPYGMGYDNKHYHVPGTSVNMIIVPGMMTGGRLENNSAIFDQAVQIMDHSTLIGLSTVGKSLAINLCMMPVLFDEMNRFTAQRKMPDYTFRPQRAAAQFSRGISNNFRMRGPVEKEFILKASAATAVTISRTRFGSRPKGEPTFHFQVKDPAGKTIFSARDSSKATRSWKVSLPAKGTYTVRIHDDWAGIWHAQGKNTIAYARIMKNYDFANAAISRQFITIPAGTKAFTILVNGVHQGGCVAFLLRPDGTLAASADGDTAGTPLLPWFKPQRVKTGVLQVKFDTPTSQAQAWKLVVIAGGDVKLNVKGIPGYLSLVPVPFEK
ncbi:MAG: hypothetical protein IKC65_02890, partial [Lentisphaeria bacterium]|nr:hypothetical protein [Lentisphaeria bacterium]